MSSENAPKSGFNISVKDYPKLHGQENYQTWADAWEVAFDILDLWEVVSGETIKPEIDTEGSSTSTNTVKNWTRKDKQAKFFLYQAVDSTFHADISASSTSRNAWQAFKDRFDKETPATNMILLEAIWKIKLSSNQSISDHTTKFETAWNRLAQRCANDKDNDGTTDEFRTAMKAWTQSEAVKGTVFMLSVNEIHPDLCDVLSARKTTRYVDVRDYFLGRAAEKTETVEEEKVLSVPRQKLHCNWCVARGKKSDNHTVAKCRGLQREKKKKNGNKGHTAATTDATVTILMAKSNKQNDTENGGRTTEWLCDSGATSHLSPNSGDFLKMTPSTESIVTADGRIHQATASGDARINVRLLDGPGRQHTVILKRTLYVPSFRYSLVSESRLDEVGVKVTVEKGMRKYEKDGRVFMVADKKNGLWNVRISNEKAMVTSYEEWHQALGHPKIIKDCYEDMNTISAPKYFECDTCNKYKSTHSVPKTIEISTSSPFDKVHSDLSGRMSIPTLGKNEYYMTFVDDYTRYCWIYLLKSKDGAFTAIQHFWELVQTQFGKRIKRFHSDQGTEYLNQSVTKFFSDKGAIHTTSPAYNPESNGVAERINRTLTTMVRCMLPGDRKFLWGEAYSTAAYLYNRRWHSRIKTTPFERLHKTKPTISHLRPWFTNVMVHIPAEKRGKFDQTSEEGYLVGYTSSPTIYRIYIPKRHTITEARDVKFIKTKGISFEYYQQPTEQETDSTSEEETPPSRRSTPEPPIQESMPGEFISSPLPPPPSTTVPKVPIPKERTGRPRTRTEKGKEYDKNISRMRTRSQSRHIASIKNTKDLIQETEEDLEASDLDDDETQVLQEQHARLLEKMEELKKYLEEDDKEVAGLMYHIPDPKSYKEAMKTQEKDDWQKAMDEEIKVLEKRRVGEEVDRPSGKRVLTGRWVYKAKVKKDGTIERRKARYCAKGFNQIPGEDFEEVYAPVARLESLRMLLSISVQRGYSLRQLDIKSAFLYGDIDCETYLELPEGYRKTNKVWKLKKAIYGLKQSPRLWYQRLIKTLETMNLTVTDFDPCILVSKNLFCCVYVDDILITGKPKLVNQCVEQLQSHFQCTDSGQASLLLGMQIETSNDYIQLHQERYITEVLERFNMTEAHTIATPLEPHSTLKKANDDEELCDQKTYQSIIGSLMYAAVATRPDIAHATAFLSQFSSKPTTTHLTAAKRVLRYLKGTKTKGLRYTRDQDETPLRLYCDASFASNLDDRKSFTGLVVQTYGHTVIWRSKKQKTVATSTTEAEYVALAFAARQSVWINRGLSHMDIKTTPTIYCDNTAAIKLTENAGVSDRTKHIDVQHHYTRELRELGKIEVLSVETENNLADICTKGLSRVLFEDFSIRMGMKT